MTATKPPKSPRPPNLAPDELATRWSLLTRLKNWEDQDSWREFFDTYWRLLHNVALKSGLTDAEAQDAVQETILTVAKNIKKFKTNPDHGSFRAWLLNTARWRVINQFKKRKPDELARAERAPDDTARTTMVDRQPAPPEAQFEALWDEEWHEHIIQTALQNLKCTVKPKHFQIFHLYTIRGKSVREVAKSLGVNPGQVYLVKHRLNGAFKKEVERLKEELK